MADRCGSAPAGPFGDLDIGEPFRQMADRCGSASAGPFGDLDIGEPFRLGRTAFES
jgi:hypothetical protein